MVSAGRIQTLLTCAKALASSPGHSRDKIWEWPGDEATKAPESCLTLPDGFSVGYFRLGTRLSLMTSYPPRTRGPRTKCPLPGQDVPPTAKYQPHFPAMGSWGWGLRTRLGDTLMQRTTYGHAMLLLTSLVSKPHFWPSPETRSGNETSQ